jgi:hypothetical protein
MWVIHCESIKREFLVKLKEAATGICSLLTEVYEDGTVRRHIFNAFSDFKMEGGT